MAAGWPSNQEEYADVLKELEEENNSGPGGILEDSGSYPKWLSSVAQSILRKTQFLKTILKY